jgi:hypothetical protein
MLAFSIKTVELHKLLIDRENEAHGALQRAYAALSGELNRILFGGTFGYIEYLFDRLSDERNDILVDPEEVHVEYIEWQWNRYFGILKSIVPDEIDDGVSLYSLINDAQQEPLDQHLKSYRSTFMMYDLVVNFHSIYSFFFDVTYHENDLFHQYVMRGASYLGLEWKDVALSFRKKLILWRKDRKRPHKYDKLSVLDRPMTELEERGIRMADYAYKGEQCHYGYRPTKIIPVTFSKLPLIKNKQTLFDLNYGLRGALFMIDKDKTNKDLPDNAVYLMFSGTQSWHNKKTDVSQFLHSDAVYYAALSVMQEVNVERQNNNYPVLVVGGHSLGGGLAQFSVGASKDKRGLIGLGYNSAGLSNFFLSKVIGKKTRHFTHIFIENDPIHKWANQIGRCIILPEKGRIGHYIESLEIYIGKRYYCIL